MPNTRYFYFMLLPVTLLLSACGVLECVDKQIPRQPVPLAKEYRFELHIAGAAPMVHTIRCEEFYSASCSERGNYWAVREVGQQRKTDRSTFRFKHSSGKEYDLELPTCGELIYPRKSLNLDDIRVIYERGKYSETIEGSMTTTTS